MMNKFWKAALAVGGIAAIGAFVFWSLYNKWLSLPIFSKMSSDQTFSIMIIFLILTFVAFVILAVIYLVSKNRHPGGNSNYVFELHESWDGVNEIDCGNLIGPDVTKAVRAMTITATSWLNNLVEKEIIMQNHFEDYETLYKELTTCDKIVPGFERKKLKCKDVISSEMMKAYTEMKKY